MTELINSYGLDTVQAYMGHIQVIFICIYCIIYCLQQENAEVAVREMLKMIGTQVYTCILCWKNALLESVFTRFRLKLKMQYSQQKISWMMDHVLF